MNQKQRRRCTAEFKSQAIQQLETGRPLTEIAEELCTGANLLYSWKNASERAQAGSERPRAAGGRDGAGDLRALRREHARLRQENEILKMAAVLRGMKP